MTFRPLRRSKQGLTESECNQILKDATSCVLSLFDEEYPYSVPISFVHHENHIYFHGSKMGHKTDCITKNPKLSLCIISQDDVQPQLFATYYKSVVIFGTANFVTDDDERRTALRLLNQKYSYEYPVEGEKEIEKDFNFVQIVRIDIDHITGKQAKDLSNQ